MSTTRSPPAPATATVWPREPGAAAEPVTCQMSCRLHRIESGQTGSGQVRPDRVRSGGHAPYPPHRQVTYVT
jgi:hypothetical protein